MYAVDQHVATVTLNRPERLNAFSQTMIDEFRSLWAEVRLDEVGGDIGSANATAPSANSPAKC